MSSHPYNTRLSARKRRLGELQDETVKASPTTATQGRTKRRRKNLSPKPKSSAMPLPEAASRSALSPLVGSITTSSQVHTSQSVRSGDTSNLPSRTGSPSRIDVSDSKRLKSTEGCNSLPSKNDPKEHWDPALRSPEISHPKEPTTTTTSPEIVSGTDPECDTESSCSFDASILIPPPSPDPVGDLEEPLRTDQESEEQILESRDKESNVEVEADREVQEEVEAEDPTSSALNRFWRFFFF